MPTRRTAAKAATASAKRRELKVSATALVSSTPVDDESRERQLNLHLDPEHMAGVYANFANVSFSDYEFTITFARIDHEVEDGDIPGVVVSRVNMSTRFMRELIDAMQDSYSKWSTREGIKNLPETDGPSNTGGAGSSSWSRRRSPAAARAPLRGHGSRAPSRGRSRRGRT